MEASAEKSEESVSNVTHLLYRFFSGYWLFCCEYLFMLGECQESVSGRMAGTVNWGTATVIGVFAGMLYGGSKEASASVVGFLSSCLCCIIRHY